MFALLGRATELVSMGEKGAFFDGRQRLWISSAENRSLRAFFPVAAALAAIGAAPHVKTGGEG